MSYSADEIYEFYTERMQRAKKQHRCCACNEEIRLKDQYAYISAAFAGEFVTFKRCLRCQAMHNHLRLYGDGDLWPDERLNCGEEFKRHWGFDPPSDLIKLAFITKDEAQALIF